MDAVKIRFCSVVNTDVATSAPVLRPRSILACNATMPRSLVWIERPDFVGFGCSECQWVFHSAGPLVGTSLDQMKQTYEAERDKEFAARHLCQVFNRNR
jgi:hypothetical protein